MKSAHSVLLRSAIVCLLHLTHMQHKPADTGLRMPACLPECKLSPHFAGESLQLTAISRSNLYSQSGSSLRCALHTVQPLT